MRDARASQKIQCAGRPQSPRPPRLGETIEEIVERWRDVRAHGPSGTETAICSVVGLGVFQWGVDGLTGRPQLQRMERAPGRMSTFEPASGEEYAAVMEALAEGWATVRTSGTCSPYADRSAVGRVLHQATGRRLSESGR